jgi:hypothetical protein
MFNAHANANDKPESSDKQYLIIGLNNEFLLSTHSLDPSRLIVHPASGRSLFWSGESLTTAFETKKIMTLYTFNNSVLVQAVDIENPILSLNQCLIKINTKLYSFQDLEAAYEKGIIISISIKIFNKINGLIRKQQFAQAKAELKLTSLKKLIRLKPTPLIKEDKYDAYQGKQFLVSSPTGELIFSNYGLSTRLIVHPASGRASSLTGEALKKAFIEQKVLTRSQCYGKILVDLNSLMEINSKLFTSDELEKRFAKEEIVSVTPAQFNQILQVLRYSINNVGLARDFLKEMSKRPNPLARNQRLLANNRSIVKEELVAPQSNFSASTNNWDLHSADVAQQLFDAPQSIASNANEHTNMPSSNNKKRRRNVADDKIDVKASNEAQLEEDLKNGKYRLSSKRQYSKAESTPVTLSRCKSENTVGANNSNIDNCDEMLLDSDFDALVEALYSDAVVSQSATYYSNNDDDSEEILKPIKEDIAPLSIEQGSHLNNRSLQQPLEVNYHRTSPCFFKSPIDKEHNNSERFNFLPSSSRL